MAKATALEAYMLNLINADRAKAGVGALVFDGELNQAADNHTSWMGSTGTLSHTGAGGSSPGDRIKAAGYDGNSWAENVAYASDRGAPGLDQADVQTLHTNLMNSPGHRANLLAPNSKDIGIGLKIDSGKAWVTEAFGSPSARQSSEPDDGAGGATPAPAPMPPVPAPQAPATKGVTKVGNSFPNKLVGSPGDDILIGGKGHDILTGGKGADTFVFKVRDGIDKILDFKPGEDFIRIKGVKFGQIEQQDTKAGMLIEVDPGPGADIGLVFLAGVHQPLPESCFIH